MIDFSSITKTLDGFDCHYFGTRTSYGSIIHCFGVFHPGLGVHEVAYDANGKRLKFENGSWVESTATNYQIVKSMRTVEVVRWVALKHRDGLLEDHEDVDDFYVLAYMNEPKDDKTLLAYKQHTFRFEVPE